jgi:hypothetical protein
MSLGCLLKKLDVSPLKTGLLAVAVFWFVFTFFEFVSNIIHASNRPWNIMLTDTLSAVGLGFRSIAALIAVITIASYFFARNIGKVEALMSLRWIVLLEAFYWAITFIPAGLWGVSNNPFSNSSGQLLGNLVVNFIPCMLGGILIPIALFTFYSKLSMNKPVVGAIKWGLISGFAFLLVFWVTNTGDWVYTIMQQRFGLPYIIDHPLNMLSFVVTVAGLMGLTAYAGYVAKKSAGVQNWRELDFTKIGAVVVLFGLFYAGIYVLWILAGSVGGWSSWYAWFLGHDVDLWIMTLPLVGLPLMFYIQKEPNGGG